MIVLGIETSTTQTAVAVGSERGTLASMLASTGRPNHEFVAPAVQYVLRWSGTDIEHIGGIAVGRGPGLFTGLRVGIQTAKSLAQVIGAPVVGLASLDVLAFAARHSRHPVAAVIDARRGEVFYALYRPVPGGVQRILDYAVGQPSHLLADLEALGEDVLAVGDGALRYRHELENGNAQVEFATATLAYPSAEALVELSIPRFLREEFDRVADVVPLYLRKSDAEIAWDDRARTG